MKPLAITQGDPAGIGPELIARLLKQPRLIRFPSQHIQVQRLHIRNIPQPLPAKILVRSQNRCIHPLRAHPALHRTRMGRKARR